MSKISICIDTDENVVSAVTQNDENIAISIKKFDSTDGDIQKASIANLKSDDISITELNLQTTNLINVIDRLNKRITQLESQFTTIQVGKLTYEQMKRFNLGSYSK